jgi:hypothetical protein
MEGRQDALLLARIDRDGGCLVHIGCSSAAVRRAMQGTWG